MKHGRSKPNGKPGELYFTDQATGEIRYFDSPTRTPLKRSTIPLPRRTRLRQVGKKGRVDAVELRATKLILMARSGGRCEARFSELCTGVGVTQHHVRRRSQGGSNDETNLVWICAPCHLGGDGVHAGGRRADAEAAGLIARTVAP